MTSETDVVKSLELCKSTFGRLDATVNCAGIGVAFKTYNHNKKLAHKLEDFEKVLKVHTIRKLYINLIFVKRIRLNG